MYFYNTINPKAVQAPLSRRGGAMTTHDLVPGLSKAHICTLGGIEVYEGGGKVEVKRIVNRQFKQRGGGERGKVTCFSKGSRRRMMYRMAEIRRDVVPVFVTLTYPDEFPCDLELWTSHMQRLRMRIIRKGWSAVWRREFKIRKSGRNVGEVAPHYHLLVWGTDCQELRRWISTAWWECCGQISDDHLRAGTKVEILRSWRGVISYVSKYMAKVEEYPPDLDSVGRAWGIINSKEIPWASVHAMMLSNAAANQMIRYMRRYARLKARSRNNSLIIFCNNPMKWLDVSMNC